MKKSGEQRLSAKPAEDNHNTVEPAEDNHNNLQYWKRILVEKNIKIYELKKEHEKDKSLSDTIIKSKQLKIAELEIISADKDVKIADKDVMIADKDVKVKAYEKVHAADTKKIAELKEQISVLEKKGAVQTRIGAPASGGISLNNRLGTDSGIPLNSRLGSDSSILLNSRLGTDSGIPLKKRLGTVRDARITLRGGDKISLRQERFGVVDNSYHDASISSISNGLKRRGCVDLDEAEGWTSSNLRDEDILTEFGEEGPVPAKRNK